jgi:hypothetical protein
LLTSQIDINGDGKQDLIEVDRSGVSNATMWMNGGGTDSSTGINPGHPAWYGTLDGIIPTPAGTEGSYVIFAGKTFNFLEKILKLT